MHTVKITGAEKSFDIDVSDSLLSGALRAGQTIPYECNSGGCGACKFDLVAGEVEDLWPDAPGLSERDRRKGKKLACQCRALSDVEIKLASGGSRVLLFPPQRIVGEIANRQWLSDEMYKLVIKTPEPVSFVPGQYFMLTFGDVGTRAYSAANVVGGCELTFIIKVVPNGRVSNAIANAKSGEIRLDGPYGMSTLTSGDELQSVFVAGGSGIAPMMSMVNTLIRDGYTKPITVFYGSRLRQELDVCDSLFAPAVNLKMVRVLSIPELETEWQGPVGFIHEHIPSNLTTFDQSEFYLCGPPPMINAVQKLLMLEHCVDFNRIHFDRFF